jgi:hypothetical protein
VRSEFKSGIVLFCFSFIFVSFGESGIVLFCFVLFFFYPGAESLFFPLAGSKLLAFVAWSVFAFPSASPLHPPLIRGSTIRQGPARFFLVCSIPQPPPVFCRLTSPLGAPPGTFFFLSAAAARSGGARLIV